VVRGWALDLRGSHPVNAPSIAPSLLRVDHNGAVTLVGGYSPSSGLRHFPLSPLCPYTGADDVEQIDLPTTGRLWLWTEVGTAPPGYRGRLPYQFGVVVLDGEPELRVITRLLGDTHHVGERMVLSGDDVIDPDGNPAVTWAFRPAWRSIGTRRPTTVSFP